MISKSEFEAHAPIELKVPAPHSKQADAPVIHAGHRAINLRARSTVSCRCKHVAKGSILDLKFDIPAQTSFHLHVTGRLLETRKATSSHKHLKCWCTFHPSRNGTARPILQNQGALILPPKEQKLCHSSCSHTRRCRVRPGAAAIKATCRRSGKTRQAEVGAVAGLYSQPTERGTSRAHAGPPCHSPVTS